MRIILMSVICLLSLVGYSQKKGITFKYIGESDKPFPSIFITTQKIKQDFDPKLFVYNVKVAKRTLAYIEENIKKLKDDNDKNVDSLKSHNSMVVIINGRKYAQIERKEAVIMLKSIQKILVRNYDLPPNDIMVVNEKVNKLIVRIDW